MRNAARACLGGRGAILVGGVFLTLTLGGCVSQEAKTVGLAQAGPPSQAAPAQVASQDGAGDEAVTLAAYRAPQDGPISGSSAIDSLITRAAAENDIPAELAFAVVRVESHYNPKAKGRGVYGLSQIMPATARSMGFSGPTEALFDPETNLRYGMRYLKGAYEKAGGDICRTSMKYKGGHRATTKTRSAQTYCSNVKRHMASITGRAPPAATPELVQVAAAVPAPRAGVAPSAPVAAAALAPAREPASSNPAAGAIAASVAVAAGEAPAEAAPVEIAAIAEPGDEKTAAAPAAADAPATGGAPASDPSAPDPSRFGN